MPAEIRWHGWGGGDGLGGGGSVARLGQEIRHTGGAVYGLEECVCARGEHEGAVARGGAGDAVWADVPTAGDPHHCCQFGTSEGLRFILHLLRTIRYELIGR